jgi:hypothetical protein
MKLPSVVVPAAVWFFNKKVIQIADFDLSTVSPLKAVQEVDCPSVFGHVEGDQFVPFSHVRILYDASKNREKFLMVLAGTHNSRRDCSWLRLGVSFALERLGIHVKDLPICEARVLQEKIAHFETFGAMVENSRVCVDQPVLVEADELLTDLEEVRSERKSLMAGEDLPIELEVTSKRRKRRHRKPSCPSVGVQTLDLFGLPPIGVSARTAIPEGADLEPAGDGEAREGSPDRKSGEKRGSHRKSSGEGGEKEGTHRKSSGEGGEKEASPDRKSSAEGGEREPGPDPQCGAEGGEKEGSPDDGEE